MMTVENAKRLVERLGQIYGQIRDEQTNIEVWEKQATDKHVRRELSDCQENLEIAMTQLRQTEIQLQQLIG